MYKIFLFFYILYTLYNNRKQYFCCPISATYCQRVVLHFYSFYSNSADFVQINVKIRSNFHAANMQSCKI